MTGPGSDLVLEVKNLSKSFPVRGSGHRRIRAVDDVSLHIKAGETLAVVGESGSGKSTLGRCIVRGIDPSHGQIILRTPDGEQIDIAGLPERQLRRLRRHFHMIFQDPFSSLDPRMTVRDIVAEPPVYTTRLSPSEITAKVVEVLNLVGLNERHLSHYPHAFSGGQRQRIGIARSLVCTPSLIVCDESVSALDVSVQAQILNLLKELQQRLNISLLFIAHDIAVVEFIAHRVAVMYVGRLVELGKTSDIVARPLHPYSETLLSSVPMADPHRKRNPTRAVGEIASPINPPSGCHFHPRCPYAQARCKAEVPEWREHEPGRFVACHRAGELSLSGMIQPSIRQQEPKSP